MRIIRDLTPDVQFNQPIVTLGTYDGVHLGHQTIIREMVSEARKKGKESVLLTFHPHPRMVLYPESHSVRLIDTIEEKLEKLEKLGLDTVILFPFTIKFSRLTAVEFVRDVLVNQIGVSQMLVGYDHHFGKNREGNFQQLEELGVLYDFEVREIKAVETNGIAVSSTKIRKALAEGEMKKVEQFLGVPYQLSGVVIHGNKLGRTIGFPTANLYLDQTTKILPEMGVYAVQIIVRGNRLNGVMNIGKKPTVQQTDAISVEVFIFDFEAEIYDETVRVYVYDRLRGEQRFGSIDELKSQLKKDEENARSVLTAMV
ncbi:MAG: bifunctional riboflavin kinase/FAD synthetase [Fluviicola sp.]|nr:bifunctional riboflavin kinase/FAD synthetase [Fluviicola sp.]